MRLLCFSIRIIKLQLNEPAVHEHRMFFGTVNDVLQDLKDAERQLVVAMMVHANDPPILVELMNRTAVFKHLLSTDLNKLPVYPAIGAGESQFRYKECQEIAFVNEIHVSIRGEKDATEIEHKPLNILLPPGVRV